MLRYNPYPAAEPDGTPAPGYSQGQAIQTMQQLAAETLPGGLTYEWTLPSCSRWCRVPGPGRPIREPDPGRWRRSSITGVLLRGQDNNILTQVGFIVLMVLRRTATDALSDPPLRLSGDRREGLEAANR